MLLTLCASFLLTLPAQAGDDGLKGRIESLGDVRSAKELPSGPFAGKYEVMLSTPLDWQDPSKGTFEQRVVVMHAGYDRPTMVITQGYGAGLSLRERYREEISEIFDTNIVFVEHRYFSESTPQPCDWRYLTAEQSAFDLHHVVTLFKQLYPNKWIASGISKGGTTTMLYCAYFPDDADIWVPYVGPLCSSREDKRFRSFLATVGDEAARNRVHEFQIEALKRREALLPAFTSFCEKQKLNFRLPIEEIYDYCVLEFAFSFWQWGMPADKIPAVTASDREIIDYLLASASPDYFATDRENSPFFIQASRELGYYGYDIRPFRKYLAVKSSKDYLRRIFVPEELSREKFDKSLYRKVSRYLRRNDPKMVLVYGGDDPWTAPGATWVSGLDKRNMKVFVQPGGSHRSRINTLPEEMRQEAIGRISRWLKE